MSEFITLLAMDYSSQANILSLVFGRLVPFILVAVAGSMAVVIAIGITHRAYKERKTR